jgi:hypothetical protein
VRNRLAFLAAGDEQLFDAVQHIGHIDRKTVFIVFCKQERKGKLFNFRAGTEPRYRFEFPEDQDIETDDLHEIDEPLLATFRRRVEELG